MHPMTRASKWMLRQTSGLNSWWNSHATTATPIAIGRNIFQARFSAWLLADIGGLLAGVFMSGYYFIISLDYLIHHVFPGAGKREACTLACLSY